MLKQKILSKLENEVKSFNYGIFAVIGGMVEMFLSAPYSCFVFTKMTNDKEWAEQHSLLELLSVVVMTLSALLGLYTVAPFKMAYKLYVAFTVLIRTATLVLLPMVTAELKFSPGEEALKTITMIFGSIHVLSSIASLFITSKLSESSKRFMKIFLKSYLPAIIATILSTLVIYFAVMKQAKNQTFYMEYFWYTLGTEILLAGTYFTAIYNMLKYGTKEEDEEDEGTKEEVEEDEETKEEKCPIVASVKNPLLMGMDHNKEN